MEKEFIPHQESVELKELGFNEPCFGYRDGVNYLMIKSMPHCIISAPTFSQAFRWFRQKYKLHSTITSISQESWQWHITKPGESLGKLYDEDFYTYEEAELACLKKLIEIVKK